MVSDLEVEEVPLSIASHQLKVSWAVAWRRLLRGELNGRKVGGSWRVTRESLDRAIAQQGSAPGDSRGGTNGGA